MNSLGCLQRLVARSSQLRKVPNSFGSLKPKQLTKKPKINFRYINHTLHVRNFVFDRVCIRSYTEKSTQSGSENVAQTSQFVKNSNESSSTESGMNHEQMKIEILERALKHVPKYGWSIDAISIAVEEMQLPLMSHGLVENGPLGLLRYHIDKSNHDMINKINSGEFKLENMTLRERLSFLIRVRLEYNLPFISRWAEALALQISPNAICSTIESSALLADEICYQCGDASFDMNWYTRRAAVMAVYGSTELFMLTDASPSYIDTWDFLSRRIDDMVEVSKSQNTIGNLMGYAFSLITSTPKRQPKASSSQSHHSTQQNTPM